MKKQNIFVRIAEAIAYPFVSIAILIDEDRRNNFDGEYNEYWLKKNAKLAKKEAKRAKREAKREARK